MVLSFKPAQLSRYRDIARLFFKYGRGDLLAGAEWGDPGNGHARPAAAQTPKASEFASDLEAMGPVFIKIGQLLSTRPDILPVSYVEALARLQDDVAPFPYHDVEQIVTEELGVRMHRAFSSFDAKPVSAASLGQVHRATMRDGRAVAVKVQRPHIRERMADDLDAIQHVAKFLDRHTDIGKRLEFQRVVDEFHRTLMRELDYRQEAQNLRTLAANLQEFTRIAVPAPIDDYTTTRVLTMEFVSGAKITSMSPLIKTEIDGKGLAEELFRAYLKQILIDGFFHADPHPGNILLTNDSRIALLDLGMTGNLTPTMRQGLLRMLLSISEGRGEDAAETFLTLAQKRDEADDMAFKRQVSDLVARYQSATLKQIAVGKTMMDVNRLASDCGIRPPGELAALGKTLLNLDEVGRTLNPEFDPNESIRRNAASMLQRRMLDDLTPGNLLSGILEAKEMIQQLPRKVSRILTHLADNDMKVQVDAIDEDKLMSGFQKVANRITVGLILAALIIGAALLMRVDTPAHIFGYPALAIVFFLLAAAGGVMLVVQVLFHDKHAG